MGLVEALAYGDEGDRHHGQDHAPRDPKKGASCDDAHLRRLEAIAHARLRHDEPRPDRIAFDLPAQVCDVHTKILLRVPRYLSPDRLKELAMGEGTPCLGDHRPKQIPLDRREMNGLAVPSDRSRREINLKLADRNDLRGRVLQCGLEASPVRAHPGCELEGAEW